MIREGLKPKGYNCRRENGKRIHKTLISEWEIYERPIRNASTCKGTVKKLGGMEFYDVNFRILTMKPLKKICLI